MNFTDWLEIAWKIAAAFGGLLSAVAAITWWVMRQGFVSKADHQRRWNDHGREHEELEDQLSNGDKKFSTIESDLRHQPDQGAVDGLRRDISDLNRTVAGLAAKDEALDKRLGRMEEQLDRLVTFHLKGGK